MQRRGFLRAAAATIAPVAGASAGCLEEHADQVAGVAVAGWELERGVLTVRFSKALEGVTVRLPFEARGETWALERTITGAEHVEDVEHSGPADPQLWGAAELVVDDVEVSR